jgi:hypothetical protein
VVKAEHVVADAAADEVELVAGVVEDLEEVLYLARAHGGEVFGTGYKPGSVLRASAEP